MPVPPYPLVPAPTTYVNGPMKTSELRADVTNGVAFLANRPSFSGSNTSTPTVTAGTVALTLDTDNFDAWQGHSPLGANPQNYYCQAAGWYLAEGYVPWLYTLSTQFAFGVSFGVNTVSGQSTSLGQQHMSNSGQTPGVFGADLVQLLRTGLPGSPNVDYIQLQAYTDRGSPGAQVAGASPNVPCLTVRWVATGSASALAVPSNASFPVPPSFVGTAWANANIRDTVGFLSNPPILRAPAPGTQALAVGTWATPTTLALAAATVDNYSGLSGNTYTIPAGASGIYYAYAQMAIAPSSGQPGTYAAGITIGGTTTWGNAVFANAGTSTVITGLCERFRCYAGQQVTLSGFQGSGANHTVQAASRLVLAWESS